MQRVAALTDRRGSCAFVSPFFEMAPWVLIHDSGAAHPITWLRNDARDRRRLRRTLVETDIDAVLCGWIDAESLEYLMRGCVSVFLAPCSEPAVDLVAEVAGRAPTAFATFENLRHGGSR